MLDSMLAGISGLGSGAISLFSLAGLPNLIMLAVGGVLLYLGVRKGVEPLLLVPIGFGCVLVNIPFGGLNEEGGFLKTLYEMGVANELFPLLIFVGIGAMIDFSPLLEKPSTLLFGAAGQVGIFLTLLLALALGFTNLEAVSIAIIGACDGPTAIYVTSQYAPHLLGAVSVAAYSYMALVPIIQPPIMRALTTQKERTVRMATIKKSVSARTRILFP
ncbi:MAG TPA: sodium ion-translocating decarboxylase subunit beta, partial [Burkholderiales bacterium]